MSLVVKRVSQKFGGYIRLCTVLYFSLTVPILFSVSLSCPMDLNHLSPMQVTRRNTKSGKEFKHDLMVMENLTYNRNITRQYDLKGALYARYNSAGDGAGDVLLDQNFVNDMNSSPFYVSNKEKRHLQRAVWNDTTFLNVSLHLNYYYSIFGSNFSQ